MFGRIYPAGPETGGKPAREGILKRSYLALVLIQLVLLMICADLHASREKPTALVRTRLSRALSQRELIERNIDILAVYPDGRVDLAVSDSQIHWLSSKGVPIAVLERECLTAAAALDENLGAYHTYDEMNGVLDSLAGEYPDLTRIDTLGTSIEGRLIRAIKISDNADSDEPEAEVFIMGCHHARELMSVDVPLLFAEYLLTNYATSTQIRDLVDNREVWIAPMINPDGHVYVQNNHTGDWWTWWRKNRRNNGDGTFGVDPNRNYSYMWGYDNSGSSPNPSSEVYRGTAPFSEPETQAVRDFCAGRDFSVALSYHSYSELVLFPWGYAPLYTDEHELFFTLGDSLARGIDYYVGNTAMGAIYVTNGDTDDWAFGERTQKNKIYCYTIELNSYEEGGFAPPDTLIQPTFEKVLELNLTLLRRAGEPYTVLGPGVPAMYDVTILNPPNYRISWSGHEPSDPNEPAGYELVEYRNLSGVLDSCLTGQDLWTLDGFSKTLSRAADGGLSYYSGSGNGMSRYMTMESIYPISLGTVLECFLWYDIEINWDYAYLEVSLDEGLTWQTVPGDRTTDFNPNGTNRGNGITGSSGGWVSGEFYLGSVPGVTDGAVLRVRFSYITDDWVAEEGIYIDLINPVADYEAKTVLAAAHPDTFYHRWPDELGDYAYYTRAFDGEGHWSRRSNVVFHTVDDLTGFDTPAIHSTLSQNYPNPFNPTTTIGFTIGREDVGNAGRARVRLELYDVAGRRITVIRDGALPEGRYTAEWNGRGDGGRQVASGVYFLRLAVGERTFTKKAVLLR